jgi:hypothetical protein
MPAQ